ncbi:HD domain-containing protein, partial [Staphylococcus aureus]
MGITLAGRFGEPKEVIDAIAHHHDPENGETLYSVLTAAADAISA